MPRKCRLFINDSIYLVMSKCIDTLQFFKDEYDYLKLIDLLKKGLNETEFSCLSFLFLPTQYMLVIRTNHLPLHKLLRRINTSYALYYNRKYKRRGYFFDDRYKSSIIDSESYLENIICQMNILPLEAGICSTPVDLDNYRWSSHAQFSGKMSDCFQIPSEILNRFLKKLVCENYRNRISELLTKPANDKLFYRICGCDGLETNSFRLQDEIIGSKTFKTKIYALDKENRLQKKVYQKMQWTLNDAVEAVKDELNILSPGVFQRGRNNLQSKARKMLAYVSIWQLEFKTIDVARLLKISCAAVISLARCGKCIVETDGVNFVTI